MKKGHYARQVCWQVQWYSFTIHRGELKGKHKFALPSLTMEIPQQGTYVLVMSHPNCQPEVGDLHIRGYK